MIINMTTQELKQNIIKNVIWVLPEKTGGQTVGKISVQAHLLSEDIDFEIKISIYRRYMKNKELAFTLFELALDEFLNQKN